MKRKKSKLSELWNLILKAQSLTSQKTYEIWKPLVKHVSPNHAMDRKKTEYLIVIQREISTFLFVCFMEDYYNTSG